MASVDSKENDKRDELSENPKESLNAQIIAPGIVRNIENEVITGFYINIGLYPLILIYFIVTFMYITRNVVPYQFIDEKFHINQTITYLNGNWRQWDSKITTPPGLYVLGWVFHNTVKPIFKSWSTLTILRLVNLIGGIFVLPLVVLRPLFLFNAIGFWPVALTYFPLMVTYYYIYYTDIWSTIFILESLSLVLTLPFGNTKSLWVSALCATISCLFRQTNIIWSGFIMILAIERRAMIAKQFTDQTLNNYLKLFIFSIEEFKSLVLPYFINFFLFFIYLIWNRSITLGDKSNHSLSIHGVQFFYMTFFLLLFSVPIWCSKNFLRSYKLRCQLRPVKTFWEIVGIMLTIRYFTKIHPFLLADNRHYTFYLFRRLIGNSRKLIKYGLMAPIYHFSTFVYMELMRPNELTFHAIIPIPIKETIHLPVQLTHISWTALLLCTFLTIIPSPLFEPRYYILPYFFWRIFITCNAEPIFQDLKPSINSNESPIVISSTGRLIWEFLWFMLINIVMLIIFIKYTFTWVDEPFLQRIIW